MTTAEDLAREFGVSGKTLRAWLRKNRPHAHGQPWQFTPEEADAVRRDFRARGSQRAATAPRLINAPTSPRRDHSDEAYVIDLCEELLQERALRQHRFEWLRGDPGTSGNALTLPVDAYFQHHALVVEYRERQHFESIGHFDKPDRLTVSGVHRGEQRKIYDRRRESEIPRHGLRLVVIRFDQLAADNRGRLLRQGTNDRGVVASLLA